MTSEQLSDQIEELCSCHVHAWVSRINWGDTNIQLDGDFTPEDLLGIVELLKKEGLL
tara:strand:- start:475 stop:645 length:171 start_codon:yes stop_codon:yes gene_type:complete